MNSLADMPLRHEAKREYAELTLAHELGLAYYRYDQQAGLLVKVDLSTPKERMNAAVTIKGGADTDARRSKHGQ